MKVLVANPPAIVVVLLLASLGATKDSYHCQGRAQMVELAGEQ